MREREREADGRLWQYGRQVGTGGGTAVDRAASRATDHRETYFSIREIFFIHVKGSVDSIADASPICQLEYRIGREHRYTK